MKKTTGILSAVALALLLWAVALWLLPFGGYKKNMKETRYGLNEGMEVVEQIVAKGQRQYVVEDAQGNTLFRIPLRGCMIDRCFAPPSDTQLLRALPHRLHHQGHRLPEAGV